MQVTDELKARLGQVFDEAQDGLKEEVGPEEYERRRHDFVFHMTDWADDLERLKRLYDDPTSMTLDEVKGIVIGSLYHVVPHIDTAGRLLLDEVSNPFINDHVTKTAAE